MEELLILVVQFAAEVFIQLLIYAPFDLPLSRNSKTGERQGCGWLVLYLVLGGLVGWLSLLVAPRLFLHSAPLRMVNLIVSPVAAGEMSWGLATLRRSRGSAASPTTHLWTGFLFVLAFGAVRLAYGGR